MTKVVTGVYAAPFPEDHVSRPATWSEERFFPDIVPALSDVNRRLGRLQGLVTALLARTDVRLPDDLRTKLEQEIK